MCIISGLWEGGLTVLCILYVLCIMYWNFDFALSSSSVRINPTFI